MISNKVSNGATAGLVTSLVAAALQYFIPAWHSGLPGFVPYLITGAVGAAGYFGGGYLSRHKATSVEIALALNELTNVGRAVEKSWPIPPNIQSRVQGPVVPPSGAVRTVGDH